jgi:hypothetical protein
MTEPWTFEWTPEYGRDPFPPRTVKPPVGHLDTEFVVTAFDHSVWETYPVKFTRTAEGTLLLDVGPTRPFTWAKADTLRIEPRSIQ